MRKYCVDCPYWDQWEFVPLLAKSYAGHVTLGDLWAQHNEHRLIFPRIVMLLLAHATRWNTLYEQGLNVVLAGLIFLAAAVQARKTARTAGGRAFIWVLPMLSLLVFSVSQAENWFWGWQIQMFMNILAAVAGIVMLAGSRESLARFTIAIGLGVVSAYTFANGILYWPAGLLVLLMIGPDGKRRVLNARMGAWLIAAVVTSASYLYHYEHPADHPPLTFALKHFVSWMQYVFVYLGSPCGIYMIPVATVTGILGLGLFGYSAWALLRSKRLAVADLAPYAGITFYSLGSAMVSGLGRLGFGVSQALSSRYVTMSNPMWISVFVLLACVLVRPHCQGGEKRAAPTRRMRALLIPLIVLFLLLSCATSLQQQVMYVVRKNAIVTMGRDELLLGDNFEDASYHLQALGVLFNHPDVVMQRARYLQDRGLSVYRD